MVSAHSFFRADFSFGDETQHLDERELMFGVVDLPSVSDRKQEQSTLE
jgi:hypothetical protein